MPSGYDASQYVTERLMAPARDGVNVPVSIVYRRDFERDGTQPLYLYAYGAYRRRDVAELLERASVAARSRLRVRDRARARWRRTRVCVVRSRQARPAHQHVQRLRRRRELSDPTTLHRGGHDWSPRAAARAELDWCGRELGAAVVGRGRFARAVRRRAEHDPRRESAADQTGVARVGQSGRGQGGVRRDPFVLAVRPATRSERIRRCW